jgi:hypothetical protein
MPPSGLLTNLPLLVRGLLPAATRRTGKEEGGKKGGRQKEREGERK